MADDTVDQLRAGEAPVDRGRFRIDSQRALQKLRQYRLADPHHYVLELLRAAVASDATGVEVTVDADDFELRFNGAPLRRAAMEDLLGQALRGGDDRDSVRTRLFSLGVAGALALEPSFVRVQSGEWMVELDRSAKSTFGKATRHAGQAKTVVHVKERLSWRVARDAVLGSREAAVIAEHCRRYPVALTVNGERIDWDSKRPIFEEEMLAVEEVELDGARLVAGIPARRLTEGTIRFHLFGVEFCQRRVPMKDVQVLATVHDDALQRNASGSDVVDADPRYAQAIKGLQALESSLVAKVVKAVTSSENDPARDALLEISTRGPRAAVRRVVDTAQLIPGPGGEWCSVDELRAEVEAGRPLQFAHQRFPLGSYRRPAVFVSEWMDPRIMELLPDRLVVDVAREVAQRLHAAENRLRWSSQDAAPVAVPKEEIWSKVEGNGFSGEVCVPSRIRPTAGVRVSVQGKPLFSTDASRLVPGATAAIDVHDAPPLDAWDDAEAGIRIERFLPALWFAISEATAHRVSSGPMTPQLRMLVRQIIVHAAQLSADAKLRKAKKGFELPKALVDAKVYDLAGGGEVSLAELKSWPRVRWVSELMPEALASGDPAVVLEPAHESAVADLIGVPFEPADRLFRVQRRIRSQQRAGRQAMHLALPSLVTATLPDNQIGCRGIVGLPADSGAGTQVRLYCQGILVETATLTASYGLATAAVECDAFTPREDWAVIVRDAVFDRAIEQVRLAERQLVVPLLQEWSKRAFDVWPHPARKYLRAFIQKELRDLPSLTSLDGPAALAADASIFRTAHGVQSLRQIAEAARRAGKLWVSQEQTSERVPDDMSVVLAFGDDQLVDALVAAAGVPSEDPAQELKQRKANDEFLRRPKVAAKVDLPLVVPIDGAQLRGEIGAIAAGTRAVVQVLCGGRPLESLQRVETTIALQGVVDLPEGSVNPAGPLPRSIEAQLQDAVADAELRLLELAVEKWELPEARALVFQALGAKLDAQLGHARRQTLLARALVPTSDGGARPVADFDEQRAVGYVTRPIAGAPRSGPVVLADSKGVRALLQRWPSATDVTAAVEVEGRTRRAREALPRRDRFEYPGEAIRRIPLPGSDAQGEIALLSTRTGALNLFHQGRPLTVATDEALPRCAAVFVNDDRLTLTSDEADAVRDAAYHALIRHLSSILKGAAERLADDWTAASPAGKAQLSPMLLQLATWETRQKQARSTLRDLPLLQSTDGRPLTVSWLVGQRPGNQGIPWSSVEGAPLDPSRVVWLPRVGERAIAADLGLALRDVTDQIRVANERRAEARAETMAVRLASPWREPMAAPRQGEVVLHAEPTDVLKLQLYRQGILIETCSIPHPVGGMAKVEDGALTATKEWRKVARNAAFRHLRGAVEHSLERALVRRLAQRDQGWLAYARAALKWRSGSSGPLAEALPGLELFADVHGRKATLGEVMAEVARRGAVALLDPSLAAKAPADRLVLPTTNEVSMLLMDLDLRSDDLSHDVRTASDIEASRMARRLSVLMDPAPALVRQIVDRPGGVRGELSLPLSLGEGKGITLCREGVAVMSYPVGSLGVTGVLEYPSLLVDPTWTTASLSKEQRRAVLEEVDALFARMAGICQGLDRGQRPIAATYALRYLRSAGMADAAQLDRMPELAQRVADAPAFRAAEGRWVGLRTAAAQALKGNGLAVLGFDVNATQVPALALQAEDLEAEWVTLLTEVLGARRVQVVADPRAWQRAQEAAEPEDDTPLARGLVRLRREAALLRGDALGPRLTSEELTRIRLQRGGGKGPLVRYNQKTKEALLDPEHPLVRAALEGADGRPEGVYVLLAAVYGAVNRALERVTDRDEAKMLDGLVRHLAANPALLDPRDPHRSSRA